MNSFNSSIVKKNFFDSFDQKIMLLMMVMMTMMVMMNYFSGMVDGRNVLIFILSR